MKDIDWYKYQTTFQKMFEEVGNKGTEIAEVACETQLRSLKVTAEHYFTVQDKLGELLEELQYFIGE